MICRVITVIIANFLFITTVFAAQDLVKTPNFQPESLDELNKELLKQKEQMDPFANQDVKVDLESLGLDNVDGIKSTTTNNVTATQNNDNVANNKTETKPAAVFKQSTQPQNLQPVAPPAKKEAVFPTFNYENSESNTALPSASTAMPVKVTNAINVVVPNKVVQKPEKLSEFENVKNTSPSAVVVKDLPAPENKDVVVKESVATETKAVKFEVTTSATTLPKIEEKTNAEPVLSGNNNITDKIKNFSNITETKAEAAREPDKKNQDKALENKDSNKPSKEEIAAEKKRIANEKKQKARAEKLEKLKKQYLIDYSQKNGFLYGEEEVVVPQKRDIDKFVSYETPAPPIMETLRTTDNFHIPSILTYKDKVENLFKSISSQDISYFKSIYDEIGQPNLRNENGDTILTYSLLMQKYDVVASILLNGADPNLSNALGYTPLEIVIELADSKSLKLLADNNVDVNYVDAFKRTYLMHAARVGFLPAVEFLIKKGVDVNAMDEDGFSALAIAYRHKKDIIIKYLLKHGAKPWVEKPYDPRSQLLIKELREKWKN